MCKVQWEFTGNNGDNYSCLFGCWGLGLHIITGTEGKDVIFTNQSIMYGHFGDAYGLVADAYFDPKEKKGFVFITNGVGKGYRISDNSSFFSVEKQVFDAMQHK